MPTRKKPELVIPVNDDHIWGSLFSERRAMLGLPPAKDVDHGVDHDVRLDEENAYVADGDDGDDGDPGSDDPRQSTESPLRTLTQEELADPRKQHEVIDSFRSTDGIDYETLRQQATQLVALRIELERAGRKAMFRKLGKERYPQFATKFPKFFDAIRLCETHRLNEFLNVMHMMLTKLSHVKNNVMTHTEMRNEVFEKNLANMYYKRKPT